MQLTSTCAPSFARNWQLSILNQQKGENDHRKYFMMEFHIRMSPDPAEIEPTTSWSPVRHTSDWATKDGLTDLGAAGVANITSKHLLAQFHSTRVCWSGNTQMTGTQTSLVPHNHQWYKTIKTETKRNQSQRAECISTAEMLYYLKFIWLLNIKYNKWMLGCVCSFANYTAVYEET